MNVSDKQYKDGPFLEKVHKTFIRLLEGTTYRVVIKLGTEQGME